MSTFYKSKSKSKPRTYKPKQIHSDQLDDAIYLVIVESPSKCKKIESYLGKDYCCIASMGHIRTLNGLKSIDTKKTFEPTFEMIDEKQTHVNDMKKVISKFKHDKIYIATDDDREGEAIGWHICEVFDLPVDQTRRIIFHEVTKPALQHAVDTPTYLNMKVVKAQHARQVLDVIVGYKISPYLWKYLYNDKNNALSAGRCQTPALRLVYDNEKQIRNAQSSSPLFKIYGDFLSEHLEFVLKKEFEEAEEVAEFMRSSAKHKHILHMGTKKQSKRSPPKPLNTSALLQLASSTLSMSPGETMKHSQILYQNGYITYMRTDSKEYSAPFIEYASKYIVSKYGQGSLMSDLNKLENKSVSNPHEAIRVTQLVLQTINVENPRTLSLYKLIWKNTIESCMSDYNSDQYEITISSPIDALYSHTLEIPSKYGWRTIEEKRPIIDVQSEMGGLKLKLESQSKTEVAYNKIESKCSVKKGISHYTEASLIKKMEDLGIGRPSTFASLVETIVERGYVQKQDVKGTMHKTVNYVLENKKIRKTTQTKEYGEEKNKLVIQEVGTLVIEFLLQNYNSLFSYEYTKQMETQLDEISEGEIDEWEQICKRCYDEIKELSKNMKVVDKFSMQLDDTYEFIYEKYGPVLRYKIDDNKFGYKNIKKELNVSLQDIKDRKYSADELIEEGNQCIGIYQDLEVHIKQGRYGAYVEWNDQKKSLKAIDKPVNDITIEDAIQVLSEEVQEKSSLRTLNNEFSVRKGKFGPYIYYKSPAMASPQFFNIKKYKGNYFDDEAEDVIKWIKETYKVE
jgi:DNA topoisomerase I|uniref:DNA topoisomerase n=1 Tax=viral metagenome TaxID=1070528 RepID=A0A6C0IUN7_9ZZZZ